MSHQQRQHLTLSPLMGGPLTLAHRLLSLSGEMMAGIGISTGTGPGRGTGPAPLFGGHAPPNPWSRRQRSMRRQVVTKPHNLHLQLNMCPLGSLTSPSSQAGPSPQVPYAATQHSQTSGSSWTLAAFGAGPALTPTSLHPGYARLELLSPLTTSNSSYQLLVPERSRMPLNYEPDLRAK